MHRVKRKKEFAKQNSEEKNFTKELHEKKRQSRIYTHRRPRVNPAAKAKLLLRERAKKTPSHRKAESKSE